MTFEKAWPPRLTWERPIARDSNGVIHEASVDWLLAEYGPPPRRSTGKLAARPATTLPDVTLPAWARDAAANLPALVTTDEAAAVLRTSRRNLYRWISAGKLESVRSGVGGSARVLVPRASIVAFLRSLTE